MSPEEFENIYREHCDLVWAMMHRTGVCGPDREDVFMEIWEAVWQSMPSFARTCVLSTWIGSIARNKCVDYLRKRRPDSLPEEDLMRILEATVAWGGLPPVFRRPPILPSARASMEELRKLVRKALEELSPIQKFATEKWLDGFSYHDIAELWNASNSDPIDGSHIGKQIYLAKSRLARSLKRGGTTSLKTLME